MEEAKNKENAKLASALEKMEKQFQETKEQLIKQLEISKGAGHVSIAQEVLVSDNALADTAKTGAEHVPVVQEVLISDNVLVNKLTAENEKLKVRI